MKNTKRLFSLLFVAILTMCAMAQKPWDNGPLKVSANHRYLQHENGKPFFWLGETGWLLPQKLDRSEVNYYLECCQKAGYNVVQVQTMNGVPATNLYGASSLPDGFNFKNVEKDKSSTSYWGNMDYVIKQAEQHGIYIGMVCVWGGLVKAGLMNVEQAKAYGRFLANRYKNSPNIVWIIGGDIRGDVKPEVWTALATTIKSIDKNHLMTFHPFGRTMSATWWNDAEWLDFNMFQSGHRRYGQKKGDGDTSVSPNTEEDNWRYAQQSLAMTPLKPVLDGEPSYEGIPQGLHDPKQPLWQACDVRRYAYWAVFSGCFGHTYGNNAIMQFYRPGNGGGYGCTKPWYDALSDPGFQQMRHLKELMLLFPFEDRVPDQSIVLGGEGYRYDRLTATRGKDYMLVYNYSARPMQVDLTKISGSKKKAWWFNPSDGTFKYIGEADNSRTNFQYDAPYQQGYDRVLVVVDADKDYIKQ